MKFWQHPRMFRDVIAALPDGNCYWVNSGERVYTKPTDWARVYPEFGPS